MMATQNAETTEKLQFIAKKNVPVAQRIGGAPLLKKPIDGRTLRRLRRYRQELKKGVTRGTKKLLPFDVVVRVDFLLEYGDTIEEIKKLKKPRASDYDEEKLINLIKEMDSVCHFQPESYEFAGVRKETLEAAGIVN